VLYLPPRVLAELGSGAIWVISFFVGFYAAVIAVLVRDIGIVLRALLEERDPEQRRILREVLRDLLESFRRGKHR
jgi:hypothetical protein